MEFNEVINKRRSIRRYKDTKISKETILSLIDCAQKAPSWKNSQVSRYYIVEELKDEVLKCLPEFNQVNAADAPILIVSTVKNKRSGYNRDGVAETHLNDGFQYFDNGLQVENLILKATEFGLGTLIMGLYDNNKIREILNIPEDETITVVIALGEPNIEPPMPQRKELEEIVNFK